MRSDLRGLITACMIIIVSCAGCALDTVVRSPPPPDREEVAGGAPSPDHIWVRGKWQWNGESYAWSPGRWELSRPDAVYVQGHWRSIAGGWVWVEGRWASR